MIAIFEDNTIWAFSAQQDTPAKKAEMEEIGHQTQLVRRMLTDAVGTLKASVALDDDD